MFENLTDKLTDVFDRLSGRGVLSAKDVDEAMSSVREALLDADVALPVVREFIAYAREKAVGGDVVKSIRPADQVVKIVHDGLVEMLGGDGPPVPLNLAANPPVVILMAGLQGSGKTTTSAKLALRLTKVDRKKVLMASLDTRRPAAMEQLAQLGAQIEVETLPIVAGQSATDIAKRALQTAKLGGYDVLILDTAGRTTLDEEMMAEAAEIAKIGKPTETLLVADALTGQDAVRTAKAFHERLPLTGMILTRADGDGRGGAALSMRHVTGLPIKFLGTSEKVDGLDVFDAQRVAGRILGMGDIVGLVEKAAAEMDQAKAERMARRMAKGKFDFDDFANQLDQMQKLGGLAGLMGLLPGVAKLKGQMAQAGVDDKMLSRQRAIINSMTKEERRKPDLIDGKRRRRIAAGAGVQVSELNRLLNQHRQMADTFKAMSRDGGRGMAKMAQMMGMGGPGGMGGMPGMGGAPGAGGMPDLEQLKQLTGGKMPSMEELQKLTGGSGGLPGLGNLPPGLNPFKK